MQNEIESDRLIPREKRTMEIIKCVGNHIHPSIQLKVDCPLNYDDRKLPILDLVWVAVINECNRMVNEFYSTDILSKAVIHAKSAHHGTKRERYLLRKYYVLCLTARIMYHGRWLSNMLTRWYYGCSFRVTHRNLVTRL